MLLNATDARKRTNENRSKIQQERRDNLLRILREHVTEAISMGRSATFPIRVQQECDNKWPYACREDVGWITQMADHYGYRVVDRFSLWSDRDIILDWSE